MKILILTLILFINLSLIECQSEEEDPKVNPTQSKNDRPIIPTDSAQSGRGLIDIIRERINTGFGRISDGFDRIQSRMQVHYQKHIERLQRKAVDSMENLQSYVDRKITSTTDPTAKEYLQKLSQNINQLMNSLRNLLTSVETKVSEAELPKAPTIPEYKTDSV